MKKILCGIIVLFIFTLNVNAESSYDLKLVGNNTFNDDITLRVKISSLIEFNNGVQALSGDIIFDDKKLELVSVTTIDNFDLEMDSNTNRFAIYSHIGANVGDTVLNITFRNISLAINESTIISIKNTGVSDGENDISSEFVFSKSITRSNEFSSISADVLNVNFGAMTKGFTREQSDARLRKVRITNNGTTTIILSNINPYSTGPFGIYSYDGDEVLAPGEYIDVQLRLADNSAYANLSGEYTDNYIFTATNINDSNDSYELQIGAWVKLMDEDYLLGDMNHNGKIDLKDIIILIKKYLGTMDSSNEDILIGDMNSNNKLDLKDIILLIKTYLQV